MRSEVIQELAKERPFCPFRITLTDGRTHDVHHPELVMTGRAEIIIGVPASEESEPVYDRAVTVSLLHIVQIERLKTSSN